MVISEKGASAEEMIKIAESRNIPIIENHALAKGLMKDCVQFQPVLQAYYEPLVRIIAKINEKCKNKVIWTNQFKLNKIGDDISLELY
jgi:type III secretory pathway component EscU